MSTFDFMPLPYPNLPSLANRDFVRLCTFISTFEKGFRQKLLSVSTFEKITSAKMFFMSTFKKQIKNKYFSCLLFLTSTKTLFEMRFVKGVFCKKILLTKKQKTKVNLLAFFAFIDCSTTCTSHVLSN